MAARLSAKRVPEQHHNPKLERKRIVTVDQRPPESAGPLEETLLSAEARNHRK